MLSVPVPLECLSKRDQKISIVERPEGIKRIQIHGLFKFMKFNDYWNWNLRRSHKCHLASLNLTVLLHLMRFIHQSKWIFFRPVDNLVSSHPVESLEGFTIMCLTWWRVSAALVLFCQPPSGYLCYLTKLHLYIQLPVRWVVALKCRLLVSFNPCLEAKGYQ